MSDTLTNHAIDIAVQYVLAKGPSTPSLELGLYVTSITWSAATLYASLTPCTAPGYTAIALSPSSWTGSTTGGVAAYSYPAQTFTFSGPGSPSQTVYGWYFVDDLGPTLLWGAQASSSYAIPSGGGTYTVTPTFGAQSC